jgi:hypothetical protein
VSADAVVPGAGNPQALNRYSYVFNNPLKYTDPSGHCAREIDKDDRAECFRYMGELERDYGLKFTDDWTSWNAAQMGALKNTMQAARDKVGGIEKFKAVWSGTAISRRQRDPGKDCSSDACGDANGVYLYKGFFDRHYSFDTVLHEMGHVWDGRNKGRASQAIPLSQEMMRRTGSGIVTTCWGDECHSNYNVAPGSTVWHPNPIGPDVRSYAGANEVEDFAMAFQLWVSPVEIHYTYTPEQYNIRSTILQEMINRVR